EPDAGSLRFFGDFVEDEIRPFEKEDEAGSEPLQCLEVGDMGSGHGASALVEILLDALGLAEKERALLVRAVHEAAQRLHGIDELLGEFHVLLILPSVAQRGETGLKGGEGALQVAVEAFQLL